MNTTKTSVAFLIFIAIIICVLFGLLKQLQVTKAQADQLELTVKTNDTKLKEMESLAKEATASSKRVVLSEKQIRQVVSILIPKKSDQDQFMKILKCENGNHDPKRVHVNAEGLGYDLGVAQINSRFHSDRVKEFFGEDFNDAMSDPVRNLVYAAYLYQHSGFNAWTCNRIVKNK